MTTLRFLTARNSIAAPLRVVALAAFVLASATAVAQRPQQGQMFERFDRDDDGVIEKEELDSVRRAVFERADASGDDHVAGEEMEALRRELESAAAGGRGDGPVRQRSRQPAPGERVQRFDTDEDGRISEQEFMSAPHPMLGRFDGNDDGRITRAEMEQARAAMREQVRERRRGTL